MVSGMASRLGALRRPRDPAHGDPVLGGAAAAGRADERDRGVGGLDRGRGRGTTGPLRCGHRPICPLRGSASHPHGGATRTRTRSLDQRRECRADRGGDRKAARRRWRQLGCPESRGAALLGLSMIPRAEIAMVIMQYGMLLGPWAVSEGLFSAMVVVSLVTCVGAPVVIRKLLRRGCGGRIDLELASGSREARWGGPWFSFPRRSRPSSPHRACTYRTPGPLPNERESRRSRPSRARLDIPTDRARAGRLPLQT